MCIHFCIHHSNFETMATVNYYLKGALGKERIETLKTNDNAALQKELKKERQIYLKLSLRGERLQVYTKKRIGQYYWNSSKHEIDCQKFKIGGVELNEWLFDLKNQVLKAATEKELQGLRLTQTELKQILENKSVAKPSKLDIDYYSKQFLALQKTSQGHSLKHGTIKKYGSFFEHLKTYYSNFGLRFDLAGLNKEFLEQFKIYLLNVGLSDNTVVRYVKSAKTFMKFYMNRGEIPFFDTSLIKSAEKEGEVFVMPLKQMFELQNHHFKNERLAKVRDIFCFMCWTGQRFSDVQDMKHDDVLINMQGEREWKLITNKTSELIRVPIIQQASEILDKYKDHITPLPVISNQRMNDYLKDLGGELKLNHKVKTVRYLNGVKQETFVHFYDILTTHTARKSYIINSLYSWSI